jgi:hypothetical protein
MNMSNQSRAVAFGFAALLCMLSGCDDCYASGVATEQTCQESGAFTANLSPGVSFACAPSFRWTGTQGKSLLSASNDCANDASFWVNVSFPRGVSEASYPLPSPEVGIAAHFAPAPPPGVERPPRQWFETADGSLVVASGTVVVHSSIDYGGSADNYGIDADVDVHFRAATGEEFSVAGHVLASQCVLRNVPWCTGD